MTVSLLIKQAYVGRRPFLMSALRCLKGQQGVLGYVLQQTPLAGRAWRASELVRSG